MPWAKYQKIGIFNSPPPHFYYNIEEKNLNLLNLSFLIFKVKIMLALPNIWSYYYRLIRKYVQKLLGNYQVHWRIRALPYLWEVDGNNQWERKKPPLTECPNWKVLKLSPHGQFLGVLKPTLDKQKSCPRGSQQKYLVCYHIVLKKCELLSNT